MLEKAGWPVFESAVTQSKEFQKWWCGREGVSLSNQMAGTSLTVSLGGQIPPSQEYLLPVMCAPQVPHSVLVAIHDP